MVIRVIELEFDSKHVRPINRESKDHTIRVTEELERTPRHGDSIAMLAESRPFAEGVVETVVPFSPTTYVELSPPGHREYDDVDELLEELSSYYPDVDLDESTELTVIWWRTVGSIPRPGEFLEEIREEGGR